MSWLMSFKESLFNRNAPEVIKSNALVSKAVKTTPVTQADFEASDAHMDQFADDVEWETLLVDLACFNDGPEYSAQARF